MENNHHQSFSKNQHQHSSFSVSMLLPYTSSSSSSSSILFYSDSDHLQVLFIIFFHWLIWLMLSEVSVQNMPSKHVLIRLFLIIEIVRIKLKPHLQFLTTWLILINFWTWFHWFLMFLLLCGFMFCILLCECLNREISTCVFVFSVVFIESLSFCVNCYFIM